MSPEEVDQHVAAAAAKLLQVNITAIQGWIRNMLAVGQLPEKIGRKLDAEQPQILADHERQSGEWRATIIHANDDAAPSYDPETMAAVIELVRPAVAEFAAREGMSRVAEDAALAEAVRLTMNAGVFVRNGRLLFPSDKADGL